MAGNISPTVATATRGGNFICLTGVVRRAEDIGFIQRGTHRLVDLSGNVIAALRSNQVNLFAPEGQFVTVCGFDEGRIEGVTSLLVTQVFGAAVPGQFPSPFPAPVPRTDIRLLLLLILLSSPGLLRGLRPDILQAILFGGAI